MNEECGEKMINKVNDMMVSVESAKDETLIVEGVTGADIEGHFNISVEIEQKIQNTNLSDTDMGMELSTEMEMNRKDTLQSASETQEAKTGDTHTPKQTLIKKCVTRVIFRQAVCDDEKNDSASS